MPTNISGALSVTVFIASVTPSVEDANTTPEVIMPPNKESLPAVSHEIGSPFDLRSRAYNINDTNATAIEAITIIICCLLT